MASLAPDGAERLTCVQRREAEQEVKGVDFDHANKSKLVTLFS
jgi:hypothetical protein